MIDNDPDPLGLVLGLLFCGAVLVFGAIGIVKAAIALWNA